MKPQTNTEDSRANGRQSVNIIRSAWAPPALGLARDVEHHSGRESTNPRNPVPDFNVKKILAQEATL